MTQHRTQSRTVSRSHCAAARGGQHRDGAARRMLRALLSVVLPVLVWVMLPAEHARADKLRDLCDVVGARDNQLVGSA